jgi:uncharacterized protein (DUF1330 family)
MSVYFVVQAKIRDEAEYGRYLEVIDDVFSRYKGEYLAVDDAPVVLEGTWDYSRVVIIRFDTRDEFDEWYYSRDYQEILKYRLNGANCDTLLINGL